jgi:hypothetical protein
MDAAGLAGAYVLDARKRRYREIDSIRRLGTIGRPRDATPSA